MATDLFSQGKPVDLMAVLNAKEELVQKQIALLVEKPNATLLSLGLNIPGPIKNNQRLSRFFETEWQNLEQQLAQAKLVYSAPIMQSTDTGPHLLTLIEASGIEVKKLTVQCEQSHPAGRILDADVLVAEPKLQSISRTDLGFTARQCLICKRDAKECGRNRTHSVLAMQEKIAALIQEGSV